MNKKETRKFSTEVWFGIPDLHLAAPLLKDGQTILTDMGHDPAPLSVALQIMNDRGCDGIFQIGDLWEMDVLSHWTKAIGREGQVRGADGQYHFSSWQKTVEMGECLWHYIAEKHPKAKKIQLEGNHDYWSAVEFGRPHLQAFADTLNIRQLSLWKDLGITYVPYDTNLDSDFHRQPWFDIGKVRVLHGYKTISARRMRQEHDNVVFGHKHQILYDQWDASSRETRRAWCIGCMTRLTPGYNSLGGQQNGWKHGFVVVYTMPDGRFSVRVVEIVDGCVPDFDGKTYYAKPIEELSRSLSPLRIPRH